MRNIKVSPKIITEIVYIMKKTVIICLTTIKINTQFEHRKNYSFFLLLF